MLGKLPFHGDFVERGVAAGDRQAIDSWLSASMTIARKQFGSRFNDAFDSAPAWQFAWHHEQWTGGALTPSVDSSGRRFPLLVALNDLRDDEVRTAAQLCENAAADAIAKRWNADQLVTAIDAVKLSANSPCQEGWWNASRGDAGKLHDRLPADILSHMLAEVAVQ